MKHLFRIAPIVLVAGTLCGHEIDSLITLSTFFNVVAGTPRVVSAVNQHRWCVAWRQEGSPAKILGRFVKPDGTMTAPKVLATGVSPSPSNFDICYDDAASTFALVFENSTGLNAQLLNSNLGRLGAPTGMESGASDASPRLVFQPSTESFLLFWRTAADTSLTDLLLTWTRKEMSKVDAGVLVTAPPGRTYGILSAIRNAESGNVFVTVTEKGSADGRLLEFAIKPDGSLMRPGPFQLQSKTKHLDTTAATAFAAGGSGVILWSDRGFLRYRPVGKDGLASGGTKSVPNVADANSAQTSIMLDAANDEFVGAWALGRQVFGVGIATSSPSIVDQPFAISTSAQAGCLNVRSSSDAASGKLISVWDEVQATPGPVPTYLVRGAIYHKQKQTGGTVDVSGLDNVFSPSSVTISVGSTVRWMMNGSNAHTVTSGSPSSSPGALFDSGTLNPGQTFSFTFNTAGTFPYFCRIHGAMMSGVVNVTTG